MSSVFDVTAYGATGNGSTDDTADIQSAINAAVSNGGGRVYFPKGTYKTSSALSISATVGSFTGITFQGDEWAASRICNASTTADTLSLTNVQGVIVERLGFTPTVTKTSGSEIHLSNSLSVQIDKCNIYDTYGKPYNGLNLDGGSNQYKYYVSWTEINGCSNEGIILGNTNLAQGVYFTNVICARNRDGVLLTNVNGFVAQYLECLQNTNHGIVTYPGTGQICGFVLSNVDSDTNGVMGLALYTNAGSVEASQICNSWFSSNGQYGVNIVGNVHGINISNCRIENNKYHGMNLQQAFAIQLDNNAFCYNSQAAANTYAGLAVESGMTNFTITNNLAGNDELFSTESNPQGYGFYIASGCSEFVFANNMSTGNGTNYSINSTPTSPVYGNGNI